MTNLVRRSSAATATRAVLAVVVAAPAAWIVFSILPVLAYAIGDGLDIGQPMTGLFMTRAIAVGAVLGVVTFVAIVRAIMRPSR